MAKRKLWDDLTFGPARRRRDLHRRLQVLDRLDRESTRRATPSRRTSDRGRSIFVAVGTMALVTSWFVFVQPDNPLRSLVSSITHTGPSRLGHPPVVQKGTGAFKFSQHQPGNRDEPVTYDPCRMIPVVVNGDQAPKGAEGILLRALDELSSATGLVFHREGSTDERPEERRPLSDLKRYGGGWSPVLIAWSSPDEVAGLAGEVVGLGGSVAYEEGLTGRLRYVTGAISLDTPALSRMLRRPGGSALAQAVVMHELGHVVGLDHVDDSGELMHDHNVGRLTFGPGDREGLAALGSGHCFGR